MINKIKGIINEFLLHYTLLFLSVKGETGLGKTQLNRAFQKVYFQKNGYQCMIYLHTIPTGLITNLYKASCQLLAFLSLKNVLRIISGKRCDQVLINDQVKAIVDDVIQNVLNGKFEFQTA
jgi:hypothetical protein